MTCSASEVLRGLHRRDERTRSTEQIGHHTPFVVMLGELDRARNRNMSVEQPLRQYDDVRGEPVTTDVTALPRPLRIRPGQRSRNRPTTDGATCVVPSVGADEVHRLTTDRPWLSIPPKDLQQMFVRRQLAPPDRLTPWPAVGQREPAWSRPVQPSVPPDQSRPVPQLPAEPRDLRAQTLGPECGQSIPRPCDAGFNQQPALGGWCGRDQRVATAVRQCGTARVGPVATVNHHASHAHPASPLPSATTGCSLRVGDEDGFGEEAADEDELVGLVETRQVADLVIASRTQLHDRVAGDCG